MTAFDGLIKVQFKSVLSSGQFCLNTMHLSNEASGSPPDFDELLQVATDLVAWLGTQYKAILGTDDTFTSVECSQIINPADGPDVAEYAIYSVNAAGTRTVTGTRAPYQATALLSFRTPLASRRFRGHVFLPPSKLAADISGFNWSSASAYWTAITNLNAKLAAGLAPSPTWTGTSLPNYTLAIYSAVAAAADVPSVANVQAIAQPATVHWLRSRNRGTT